MARPAADVTPPRRAWVRAEERRTQLADVAARKFHRLGFHKVSMADVASAVGLTAPAIYRHYRNKQDLLAAAIGGSLDAVDRALDEVDGVALHELLCGLADAAVARRDLWILLQREIRHLSPDRRAELEARVRRVARRVAAAIRRERPDLAPADVRLSTTAALAVLSSPSVYRGRLPVPHQRTVLASAAEAVCRMRWDAPDATPVARTADEVAVPASRSEEVLAVAIRLFAARGYQAVSLDDIGEELGMAGPSLYHYFGTKSDLLVAAFVRATEWLAAQRGRAAQPPPLDELVSAYVELGVRERLLFGVYVWEAVNLPSEAGRRIRVGLEADVDAWSAALGRSRPELTAAQRLVLVHAARAIVHDVVRVDRWHRRPDVADVLRRLVHAALAAPLEGGAP